jgi:hypothetical protein
MSFCDWDDTEVEKVNSGLLILGWRVDGRWTSDDAALISVVAYEALEKHRRQELSADVVDELSKRVFTILEFQIMNAQERASKISSPYSDSVNLGQMVPLIDQAQLCYYRGYYTASLATMFIVVEHYLRKLFGWSPGDKDPSFHELRKAILKLPKSSERNAAEKIVNVIYSRYDAENPPQFYFNRHGLLHGLRDAKSIDRMNCVRMFLLLDSFCSAEGISSGLIYDEAYKDRVDIYKNCISLHNEKELMYS